MPSREAGILAAESGTKSEETAVKEARVKHVKTAQYPINIARMTDDAESRRLGNMVKHYEELTLEE